MQQHMIPQDVTGYKFNLFGILNVSQFLQLIIPCFVGFLIWKVGVPIYIAIPIIFVLVVYGLMAAFVPINERPLSHWTVTFFKVIYSPTKFYWRRQRFIPEFFKFALSNDTAREIANDKGNTKVISENVLLNQRTKTADFLRSIEKVEMDDPLELSSNNNIDYLLKNYDLVPIVSEVNIVKREIKPAVDQKQVMRPRQMQTEQVIFGERG